MRNLLSKELVFSVGRASFPFNFFPSFFFFPLSLVFQKFDYGSGSQLRDGDCLARTRPRGPTPSTGSSPWSSEGFGNYTGSHLSSRKLPRGCQSLFHHNAHSLLHNKVVGSVPLAGPEAP